MKKLFFMLTVAALIGSVTAQAQNAVKNDNRPSRAKTERTTEMKHEKPAVTTAPVAPEATTRKDTKSANVARPNRPHVAAQR